MKLARVSPRLLLAISWVGFLIYAWPGYMSFDSVFQLGESRNWEFSEQHPPPMAALWRLVELFVAGPTGMLLIQSACFLVGTYLLLRHWMSDRAAAACAGLVLWFPVCCATMAVIWKDSQMMGFLLLGTALLLSPRRRVRLIALGFIWLATAMRHNALAITFPIVVLLFQWSHHGWKRYAISMLTWLAITLSVQTTIKLMVQEPAYLWHTGQALDDIVGTVRNMGPISDDELRTDLRGIPLQPTTKANLQAQLSAPLEPWDYAWGTWRIMYSFFGHPANATERAAVTRAWKKLVLGHPAAYLVHRWHIFEQVANLVNVPDDPPPSVIYTWFVDVQDPYASAERAEHDASPGAIQDALRDALTWTSRTGLFQVWAYVLLSLLLLPFCIRDRALFALVASGLTGEAVLFIVAPVTDFRYSFPVVVTTVIALFALIAKRVGLAKPTRSP